MSSRDKDCTIDGVGNSQSMGYIMILVAGTLWGTIGFFVATLAGMGVDSITAAFIRIGMGALILIPIMLVMGKGICLFKIDRKGLLVTVILGVFCQAGFNFAYSESINYVGVATAAVLLYTSPIFVCIMSAVFFKEKMTGLKLCALCINVVGCVLTVTGGSFQNVRFSIYGVAMGIMAGFLYSMMTIVSKITTDDYDSLTVLFYSFAFGALLLGIVARPWESGNIVLTGGFIWAALGFGLVPSVGSYFFYMKGLKRCSETSKVPVLASVETVVAAIIGIILFKENLGVVNICGIALVICSIGIINKKQKNMES